MIITIDFESFDPYIDRGLGSGWVYGLNVPDSDFKVLGYSMKIQDEASTYAALPGQMYLEQAIGAGCLGGLASLIVMHNASYDLGCLTYLGLDVEHIPVYDTLVAAKLYDSTLQSYSLDNLANKYLGYQKGNDLLAQAALEAGIYPHTKKYLKEIDEYNNLKETMIKCAVNARQATGRDPLIFMRKPPVLDMKKVISWCKKNMDRLQRHCPEAVAEYACIDTDLTYKLYEFFKDKVDMDLVLKYSSLSKITNSYRKKGVRVDLKKAQQAKRLLDLEIIKALETLYNEARQEFNVSSPKEVTTILNEAGLECPKTSLGNDSATGKWLEQQLHPLCRMIVDVRKLLKIKNDFILKIIDMQQYTMGSNFTGRYGRVYPELNLLQAVTGRFSCSSPNIQQIPARDEKLAPLCRGIFVAEEGEKLYSLDFSNQEGRLQVHYAFKLDCRGASNLVFKFRKDPNYDMHQEVATMAGISRKEAKTINLGLSYGMGNSKLAASLSLTEKETKQLRTRYESIAPFLTDLKRKCESKLVSSGFIKTIGGRELKLDPPIGNQTFGYKALNKLIQGSAADQTIECMIKAYEEKIPVLFPVHDQLLMSGTREQAVRLKEIMETAIPLEIPVVVDVNLEGGTSWSESGH